MLNFWKKKSSEDNGLKEMKILLAKTIDENIQTSLEDLKNAKQLLETYKSHKIDLINSLLNVSIYTSIYEMDSSIMLERFQITNRDYEKKLCSRILALSIIEFLDDINALLGRDLSNQLTKLKLENYIPRIRQISKKYAAYKNQNEQYLRQIRNNAIAHKNTSSLELCDFVFNLDYERVYNLAVEIKKLSTEFNNLSTEIVYSILEILQKRKL